MEYHTPGSHADTNTCSGKVTDFSSTNSDIELDSESSPTKHGNVTDCVDDECVKTLMSSFDTEIQPGYCEETHNHECCTIETLHLVDEPEKETCKFMTKPRILSKGDDKHGSNDIIVNDGYLETCESLPSNNENVVSQNIEDVTCGTCDDYQKFVSGIDEACAEASLIDSGPRIVNNAEINMPKNTSLSSSISDLVIITDDNRAEVITRGESADENRTQVSAHGLTSSPEIDESVSNYEIVECTASKSKSNYELSTKTGVDEIQNDKCTQSVNSVETISGEEVLRCEDNSVSQYSKSENLKPNPSSILRTDVIADDTNLSEQTHDNVSDKAEMRKTGSLRCSPLEEEPSNGSGETGKQETSICSVGNKDMSETSLRRRGIHDETKKNSFEEKSGIASPPQEEWEREKVRRVMAEVRSAAPDRETIKQLAVSRGGLLNNHLRRLAWPVLLAVDVTHVSPKPEQEVLRAHRDYEQVVLDVNRSLKRFPPGMDEVERLSMQDQLVDCIMRVLCSRPDLHYYQGYHDIVVTFLLVVGEDVTFSLMNELSMKHLRDFMYENMDKTTGMLHYLYPLLGQSNSKLRTFMEQAELGTIFALAWLITWFGHVLGDIRHIVRLYDFFIACHPLMPIYLAAAIVLFRADEILSCPPEMPIIHCLLSKIPPDLPIEKLITEAGHLFVLYPPQSLEKEANAQYEAYLAENERKRAQLQQLSRARAARGHKRSHSWWARAQPKPSALVKVTVWTGAALLSAAAVSYYITKSGNYDHMFDFHWLWSS